MKMNPTPEHQLASEGAWRVVGATFEDIALDRQRLRDKSLLRSRFIRCGFKEAQLEGCELNHSKFYECYFRKTCFRRVSFVGCEFKDCRFDEAEFDNCQLDNAEFSNCSITYDQIQPCLPQRQNILWRLARNLRVNAQNRGESEDARRFLLAELRASEIHNFKKAFAWTEPYYRRKYRGVDRIIGGWNWAVSKISSFCWGHGELPSRVLRLAALVALLFAALYRWSNAAFHNFPEPQRFADFVGLSVAMLAGTSYGATVAANGPARVLTTTESAIGLVLFGLFVAALYRRISKR